MSVSCLAIKTLINLEMLTYLWTSSTNIWWHWSSRVVHAAEYVLLTQYLHASRTSSTNSTLNMYSCLSPHCTW